MDAFESLSRADRLAPLGPEDLELLATSAAMIGRDDEYVFAWTETSEMGSWLYAKTIDFSEAAELTTPPPISTPRPGIERRRAPCSH